MLVFSFKSLRYLPQKTNLNIIRGGLDFGDYFGSGYLWKGMHINNR